MVHEQVIGHAVSLIAVQLQDTVDVTGASAVVSDGTTVPDTVTPSISVELRDALDTYFPITSMPIVSCNDPADAGYTSSCNIENIQGRHLNGSSDPCFTAASASANRSVVIELAGELRNPSRFADMASAVGDIF